MEADSHRRHRAQRWMRFSHRICGRTKPFSYHQVVREWFRPTADPMAEPHPTLRSVASMTVGFHPPKPLSAVQTPVLVLVGEDDRMVSAATTRRAFAAAALPNGRLEIVP